MAADVEPDVLCFAAATRCCCRRLDWAAAISFLETTLREGFLPTSSTLEVSEVDARKRESEKARNIFFKRGSYLGLVFEGEGSRSIYVRGTLGFFFSRGPLELCA